MMAELKKKTLSRGIARKTKPGINGREMSRWIWKKDEVLLNFLWSTFRCSLDFYIVGQKVGVNQHFSLKIYQLQ